MDTNRLRKEFTEYAERMAEIKRLSSPRIKKMDSADGYSTRLTNSFKRIGELAAINREMLDRDLYPLLESEGSLDEDVAAELENLADLLLTVAGEEDDFENLDLPVTSLIADRLLKDAEEKDDICLRISRMDAQIDVCYSMMNMTERINNPQVSRAYRDKGIELGLKFHELLNKDQFLTITDNECRQIVLTDARFMVTFYDYDGLNIEEEDNVRTIQFLDKLMKISEDEFYQKEVPGFDWKYFKYRTLEYYLQCTDIHNLRGFSADLLDRICYMADLMDELVASDKEYYSSVPGCSFYPIHASRCRYLAGKIDREEYMTYLTKVYSGRDKYDFGVDGGLMNLLLPLEIICELDINSLKADEVMLVKTIYQGISAYLFNCPNNGVLPFMLEYLTEFVNRFIEIPSGVSLMEFVLSSIAAMHPPTYVHSNMVGQISERLCYHLLRQKPELFVGIPGYGNVNEVLEHKDDIIRYTYNAALCHDFGKIFIIDTIFVYGRKLLDFEFEMIKSHPVLGNEVLCSHSSTMDYADVALFHHKWYDDSKGYPFDKRSADSKYKTIIDIVQCADCLDAATDTIGRSYNKGKSVADYMKELEEGSGTRYAPWLYDLFKNDEVYSDLEYLLNEGRKRNYRETYNLLRSVKEEE